MENTYRSEPGKRYGVNRAGYPYGILWSYVGLGVSWYLAKGYWLVLALARFGRPRGIDPVVQPTDSKLWQASGLGDLTAAARFVPSIEGLVLFLVLATVVWRNGLRVPAVGTFIGGLIYAIVGTLPYTVALSGLAWYSAIASLVLLIYTAYTSITLIFVERGFTFHGVILLICHAGLLTWAFTNRDALPNSNFRTNAFFPYVSLPPDALRAKGELLALDN